LHPLSTTEVALGPYDILSQSGLTRIRGNNGSKYFDRGSDRRDDPLVDLGVGAGARRPHSRCGILSAGSGCLWPFNWQSGALSLPTVIGYAFPLHIAYTVQIIVTVTVAGSGAYALARVLHVGALGCATAGTIYELSGSFMGWLGWPHAAVMSWAGWIFAMAILIARGDHRRTRNVVGLAAFLALSGLFRPARDTHHPLGVRCSVLHIDAGHEGRRRA
jgi:hypothetical protein